MCMISYVYNYMTCMFVICIYTCIMCIYGGESVINRNVFLHSIMTSLWYLITYTHTYTNYITVYYSNNHIHVYKSYQHISQLYTCTRHTCSHILRVRTVYNIECMIYKLHMYLRALTSVYGIYTDTSYTSYIVYSYTIRINIHYSKSSLNLAYSLIKNSLSKNCLIILGAYNSFCLYK